MNTFECSEFDCSDGAVQTTKFHIVKWLPEDKPKAAVVISHGMSEHIERYERFASFLCDAGYCVYGYDQPGHGVSEYASELGHFGPQGYRRALERIRTVMRLIKNDLAANTPVVLFGHSMGSFIAREYIATYKGPDAAIIMGTSGPNPAVGAGLKLIAFLELFKGKRGKSPLIDGIVMGAYNKRFAEAGEGEFAWLTKDRKEVEKYIADDRCGYGFTLDGYEALLGVLKRVSDKKWAEKVPKDMPLLLISGAEDPVGNFGKGVAEVEKLLRDAGLSDLTVRIFGNDRHELLNETDYKEVQSYILGYLDKTMISIYKNNK